MTNSEQEKGVALLQQLIATPSLSKQEQGTAQIIANFLSDHQVKVKRKGQNVWACNQQFNPDLPTVLLNSHHDTVKPVTSYTRDPFTPEISEGKLYGLGSNDAGGALVALLMTFLKFHAAKNLTHNLVFLASAEEEISGKYGVASVLPELGEIAFGIVGEPTLMQMAVAEKGLMVLDGIAKGKSGHAARDEGENAIYKALQDIAWMASYQFKKQSDFLGPVKMSVTQIDAGNQHNVVPDTCRFVVDVRVNEFYKNRDLHAFIQAQCQSEITARSYRLNSSSIPLSHPLIKKGIAMDLPIYGSPTLSDQALMNFPTLKIGPGDSARSHTADEFIHLKELFDGMTIYQQLLNGVISV